MNFLKFPVLIHERLLSGIHLKLHRVHQFSRVSISNFQLYHVVATATAAKCSSHPNTRVGLTYHRIGSFNIRIPLDLAAVVRWKFLQKQRWISSNWTTFQWKSCDRFVNTSYRHWLLGTHPLKLMKSYSLNFMHFQHSCWRPVNWGPRQRQCGKSASESSSHLTTKSRRIIEVEAYWPYDALN